MGDGFNTSKIDMNALGNYDSSADSFIPYYSIQDASGSSSGGGFWDGFTIGDIGKYGLGIYSILSNNKNNKAALAFGKQQLQFSKDQAAANYLQNATGWANQQLWNAQAMYNFDPVQGAQFANNLKGSLENLNNAGAKLGLSGSLDNQINSLSQYTQLKDTANAQG